MRTDHGVPGAVEDEGVAEERPDFFDRLPTTQGFIGGARCAVRGARAGVRLLLFWEGGGEPDRWMVDERLECRLGFPCVVELLQTCMQGGAG